MNRKLNYNDYRWRVRGFPFSPPWFITTPAASPLVTKIMATGFSPLGSSAYSSTTPKIAIIQPAIPIKDWRYYEKTIIAMEEGCGKLYKEYKEGETWRAQYKTWEAACAPLNKSRRRVDEIILLETIKELATAETAETPLSSNPKQSTKLKEEEPEKPQVRTADEVIAANAAKEPEVLLDDSGYPIPDSIKELWDRRKEAQELMTNISHVRGATEKYQNDHDRLFGSLFGDVSYHLDLVYAAIRDAKPYAVCPYCLGDSCKQCQGTGFVSKIRYEKFLPVISGKNQAHIKKEIAKYAAA